MNEEQLIYQTKTYCPRCTIVDRKGLVLVDGQVISRNDKVYLKSQCTNHPSHYTLYCSSLEFFKRISSYQNNSNSKDIEDTMLSRVGNTNNNNGNNQINQFPPQQSLVLELNIFQSGSFLTNDQLNDNIKHFQSIYQKNKKFVLKVMAKGTNDIENINNKVIYISNQLKSYPILLEVTVERLESIGKLPNSSFLIGKVYPALKYFIRRGDEEMFIKDIHKLLGVLGEYKDMQTVITIAMERPFADLSAILTLLRSKNDLIRFIILSLERPPKDLVQSLFEKVDILKKNGESSSSITTADSPNLIINSNDPYELIQEVERATNSSISSNDFFPINVGSALEPMFNLLGYGSFNIRPSPFCGFATCLINTDTISSRPINRLFNIGKFYKELLPILPNLEDKIGFINGLRLKSIIKSCHYDTVQLPNLFDYFTEKSKADDTRRVIDQTQILIIHNNMDIAALDLRRRCNCSVNTTSLNHTFVSSCTGCI